MKKKRFWCLVFLIFLVAACEKASLDPAEHMQRAEVFFQEKNYRSAVIELKNVLQQDESSVRARYLLGAIYVDTGDGESGERELRRVLGMQTSGNDDVVILLSRSLLIQKKYTQLLDEISIDQDLSKKSKSDLLALRGEALLGSQKFNEARADFSAALKINSQSAFANIGLARLSLLEDKIGQASQYIDNLLAIDDKNAEALLLKGKVATINANFSVAENSYKFVLLNEPKQVSSQYSVQARLGLVGVLNAQQKNEEALAVVDELIALLPQHPLPNFMRAKIAYESGDLDTARKYLIIVQQLAPEHEPTMLMLGAVNYAMGNLEQADQLLSRYVILQPDNTTARKMLASLRLQQQHHEGVVDLLSPALKNASTDAQLLALIGAASNYSGDVENGVRYLRSAIDNDPDNHFARTELAVSYLKQGHVEAAINELENAKGLEKRTDRAGVLLVMLYLREKRLDQALVVAKKMVSSSPDQPVFNHLLGTVYLNKGNNNDARQYLKRALELKGDYFPAAINLVRLELSEGKVDSALKVAEGVKNAAPDVAVGFELAGDLMMSEKRYSDALAEYKMGLQKERRSTIAIKVHRTYAQANQLAQAQAFLEQWLDEFTDDARARLVLVGGYNQLNDSDSAIRHYLILLENDPENLIALNDLAWFFSQAGDKRALSFAERAYALNKENASVLDTLGWILVQEGRLKRGLSLLEDAHERAPKMPDIQYHLAAGYAKTGDADKARDLLDELLVAKPGSFSSYALAKALRDSL